MAQFADSTIVIPPASGKSFLTNVVWNLIAVGVMLASGLLLSPYIVRKIGESAFGVWSLVFSIIEYYWLLDLGFRSATLKYAAHYRATHEPEKINEIVNTGLVYFSLAGVAVFGITLVVSRYAHLFFQISPEFQDVFSFLILVVGVSWAMGVVFNVFNACLEGFQRFDVSSRIWIVTIGVRSFGCLLLLSHGYGLKAMGVTVVVSQMLGYLLSFMSFRQVCPEFRFSPSTASWAVMKQMAGYGVHTFMANAALNFLEQGAPLLIGHFRTERFVGYYNLPLRLLRYTSDAVVRVGMVTGSSTASLIAQGDRNAITQLGLYANRYCFTLFVVPALFLYIYGGPLLSVWVKAEFARQSSPLLPILATGVAIGLAGQFNSSAILYGLAKHYAYARVLMAEAICSMTVLAFVIPQHGIVAAAWVAAGFMAVFRGLITAAVVCHFLEYRWLKWLAEIYVRPVVAALPVAVVMVLLRQSILPGRNWPELIAAGLCTSALYVPLAIGICLTSGHRTLLKENLLARWRSLALPGLSREAEEV